MPARLIVNDRDLIVCTEHGDETQYNDRSHVPGLSGRWECGHPGCDAAHNFDHKESS